MAIPHNGKNRYLLSQRSLNRPDALVGLYEAASRALRTILTFQLFLQRPEMSLMDH